MSIVGRIGHIHLMAKFRWRVLLFGGLTAMFALLSYYPERYLVVSSFTPTDRDALGLSGTLGQLGAINSVFGNQAAVEVALRIGNSVMVRDQVIAATRLKNKLPEEGRIALQRYLEKRVEVRSLRGGIVVIEMQDRNADFAKEIVTAYQNSVQTELGRVSRRQTAYKRDVLMQLVRDATDRLAKAQSRYDEFRLNNRYAEPRATISAFGDRIPQLESAIRSKEVQLAIARQVYTDSNVTVRQIIAELNALRVQLADARSTTPNQDQGVGDLVQNSSQLITLERDLQVARTLYDSYVRYLRGTAVEDLTSEANMRLLEPAYVATERQIWLPAAAVAIAIFLFWMAVEAYKLRPPPGSAVKRRGDD